MQLKAGDVIQVRHWPGVGRERYVVQAVVHVPGSPFPDQVYAHVIEEWPSAKRPFGQTGAFRAFSLACCVKDKAGTNRWHLAHQR
jgi:hypothetical protein